MSAEPPPPFSCPMCSQHFRTVPGGVSGDPRPFLLPSCGHTVCGACTTAQAAALSKENGDVIAACPMCGEGASEVPTLNGLIATAAEAAYARTHAMPVVLECMVCKVEGDNTLATLVCIGCNGEDRRLCDDHAAIHRKKAHASLVPVSEYKGPLLTASGPAAAAAFGPAMCPSHPKYELDRFCFSCEAPVCAECCLSSHPVASHTVKDVATAAGTLRYQLESLKDDATTIVGTVTGQAAVVEEACATMTADYTASREAFQAWIAATVVALRKLESDVIRSAQSLLQSKTNTLRAQGKGLRVSGAQLGEVLSLIGLTDVSNPVALAGVYGLMKRLLGGVRAKPFTGPVLSPVVKVGFDAPLLTSALEYCAWVVKDDAAGAGVAEDVAAKVDLSAAVEACGAACGAAGEALARVKTSASRVRSGLVGVRESLVSKVDRVKAAIDVAAAGALSELNDVAEGRQALLGQQERGLSEACGGLKVAGKVGRAALLSGDAGRVNYAVGVVKGAVGHYGSVFEVPSVPVALDVLFDEAAMLGALCMTVKKYDVSLSDCDLVGRGLEVFVGGGTGAEGTRDQNVFSLVCRGHNRELFGGLRLSDVSLRVLPVGCGSASPESLAGSVVSMTQNAGRPSVFTFVYAVDEEDTDIVLLDVRIYGERVARSPVKVHAALPPRHDFEESAIVSSVSPPTIRRFTAGMKSWLPGAGKPVLLFRMTRDGSAATDFHSTCDGEPSTLVLIKSTNGFVFGAYAGAAWHGKNMWIPCSKSFMFTVSNPHGIPPTRYQPNNPEFALRGSASHGPIVGLRVGDGDGSLLSQSATPFNLYSDTTGKGATTFTGAAAPNGYFTAAELEVWQVPVPV